MRSSFFVVVLFSGLVHAQAASAPFFLDRPVVGPSGGDQQTPAVAWTGTDFFVVWADGRDGSSTDLWFRRFDAQGAALTTLPAPLFRARGTQSSPAVAAGTSGLLVAWLDDTVCASEVRAQRFAFDGQPQGGELALTTGACPADRPSISWEPTSQRWLVVWGAHGANREVHGALVASDGTVVVSDFVIAAGPNSAVRPSVAVLTDGWRIAWQDDRITWSTPNIWLTSVNTTGVVGAPTAVAAAASSQTSPCVSAWAGSQVLVSWVEGQAARAQLFTAAPSPLGAPFTVATGSVHELSCASTLDGAVLLAVGDSRGQGRGVFLRTVFPDAGVSSEFAAAPPNGYHARTRPRLAVVNERVLLVVDGQWGYVTGDDVMARLLTLDGGLVQDAGPVVLGATGGTHLSRVEVAFDGQRYFGVWRDDGQSAAGSDTFGQLVEPTTGQLLLDGGVRVTTGSANLKSFPSVAGAPSGGFFVSWGDDGSAGLLRGSTVSPQGAVAPSTRLSDVTTYVDHHSSRWLVDGWTTMMLRDGLLRVRRTSVTGGVVQPETTLLATGTTTEYLDSAALGPTLLTVYLARDAGFDVRGARFDADAGLLDAEGFVIAGQPGDQLEPAVAAGRALFLAAWRSDGGVFASRVTRSGTVLDEPPLALGPGLTPAVGWTGQHFLVAWEQATNVVAARVSESGEVIDRQPVVLESGSEVGRRPRVAPGVGGETLVAFEAYDPNWASFRLQARLFFDLDAGVDAGVADAGTPDAGAPDAGEADAGAGQDAGGTDAGVVEPDAGAPGVARHYGIGCAQVGVSPALLLALLLLRRRAVT